jgi:inositol phosphorylceramide mannosyltransferase catalytic subunit
VRIPSILHQVWVGPDPLPEEFAAYRASWARHNPNWESRLWTEDDLPADLERKEAYELLRQPAERSDVIRLELLYRHGGVYADVDFECLRPVTPLLEDVDFFVGAFKPGRVTNALIGSVPGHPLLARAIREIRPRSTWGAVDKSGTGPSFLRRMVKAFPDVTVFEPDVFYPRSAEALREAYAVHHKARSWRDADGLRKLLAGAEQRLRAAEEEAREWRLRCERAEQELAALQRKE